MEDKYPMSPMKNHPAGHRVLDYREWARRTERPESRRPSSTVGEEGPIGTLGIQDRRLPEQRER